MNHHDLLTRLFETELQTPFPLDKCFRLEGIREARDFEMLCLERSSFGLERGDISCNRPASDHFAAKRYRKKPDEQKKGDGKESQLEKT